MNKVREGDKTYYYSFAVEDDLKKQNLNWQNLSEFQKLAYSTFVLEHGEFLKCRWTPEYIIDTFVIPKEIERL